MVYKIVFVMLKDLDQHNYKNLTKELEFDKRFGFGSPGGYFGTKCYIPADAKMEGL